MTTPVKLHTGTTALATVAWLLRLCAACYLLLVLPAQAATCSAYMGQASINELRIGLSGKSSTANQIEIYNSGNVSAAVWSTWQLVVYSKRSGRNASRKGGYYLSSGFTSAGPFIYNSSRSIYLRNRSSRLVDVALVDASGNFIDYLGVDGRIQTVPGCMGTPSVVDATANSDASGNVSRNPDGGALPAAVSNTPRHTIGASNTCTAGGSDLVVDINAIPDNPIVNTSTTTYTITASNKSCSNTVSAIAVTTAGISTTHFSSLSYAASQGSSSQAASALNWSVGSLSAGSSATLTVTGKPRILGALTTTASVTAPSSGLVNTGDDSKARTITVRDRNYVGFTLDSATLTEGSDTSYSAVIASNLTAASTITVTYSVSGTATLADTDLPLTGTVLIDPRDTDSDTETSIDFTIKNDALAEPGKAIRLTLISVSSSDAQVSLDSSSSVMDIDLLDDDDAAPHHLELRHASGRGLTCAADTLTLVACQDAACSTPYTGGVSGVLGASQAAMLWPAGSAFVIAPGSSSTSMAMQLPVAGTSTLGVTSALPAAANPATCNFGSPACTYSAEDSGLLASVGHHVAESSQTLTLQAVRKADNSAACVPAFANLTRALQFSCSYANPASGSRPVRIGGRALNAANNAGAACDGSSQTLSLAFNAAGIASTTLQYADAGQVDLGLAYVGSSATNDPGLTLTGSSSFIAAPAALAFSAITAGTIRAGTAFSASLAALNSAGALMPNFGRESPPATVSLSHSRAQPTGSGASNGSFTGSLGGFSGGTASASNLVWSEVGRIDLAASLGNYLGSGLGAVGSTGSGGAVGRFIPHHFDLTATPACGVFSYAGQPFRVVMTARNGLPTPGITLNYDGSANTSPNFAKALTLSDSALGGLGSFGASAGVAASAFRAGVASVSTPAYSYTDKLTAPRSLALRAIDSDAVSSAGTAEPAMPLRSGRLRVFNTFGSEKAALALPVQAQYWSGSAWVLNSADSCSVVPAAAIAPVQYLDHKGAARAAWAGSIGALNITGGLGQISVAAPPAGVTGSIDLALNLGASAVDASCLASHPASSGAGLPWLRARNGSCASGWSSDPNARVSFGIAAPETRKSVHVRELF